MDRLSNTLFDISSRVAICHESDTIRALALARELEDIVKSWEIDPEKAHVEKRLARQVFPFYWLFDHINRQ